MSFLNQLKNQAKALQTQRTEQDSAFDEQVAVTEKACQLLAPYLQDLARQLNVIEPPGPVFTLDGKTRWPPMKLVDFRVDARRKQVRDAEVTDYVAIGWRVVPQIGRAVSGLVTVNFPTEMQRVEERLASGLVKHERREIRHPEKNVLQEVRYEYLTETRGSVVATADHEHGFVHFRVLNTTGFEVVKAPYPAGRINNETLDELAKRIVAQESRFG